MKETDIEWRPVIGFEGWYEVSNTGMVKRLYRPFVPAVVKI